MSELEALAKAIAVAQAELAAAHALQARVQQDVDQKEKSLRLATAAFDAGVVTLALSQGATLRR